MIAAIGLALVLASGMQSSTQAATDERAVLDADDRFWQAYNSCDVETMADFFTEDVEFYHDRGGLTEGRQTLVANFRDQLCKPEGSRLRREAVPGTIRFDPVPGHGAILTGEHVFYVRQPGKAEHPEGQARFAHVWQFADSRWRMRRVLSYDHGPPRNIASRPLVSIPAEILSSHAGRYQSPTAGVASFTVQDGRLKVVAGELVLLLEPLSETSFMATDRDLRFDFAGDSVAVWEDGEKVDEAKRID